VLQTEQHQARTRRAHQPHAARSPLPDTPSARALQAINVLPTQVRELAELPIEVISAAIADGRSRPGVRDLAAWVVSLLRAHRDDGWTIQPPAPKPDSPEALRAAFAQYAAEQEAERLAQQAASCADDQVPTAPDLDAVGAEAAPGDGDARVAQVRQMLKATSLRIHWRMIERLELAVGGTGLIVCCADERDYLTVQASLRAALQWCVTSSGCPRRSGS
jgi:hypothetical protein